jgi:hypothetical protein
MMRMRSVLAVAALVPLVGSAAAQTVSAPNASAPNAGQWSPVGLWQAVDSDTKQPTGWFLIDDHNGVFDGIIAKMFLIRTRFATSARTIAKITPGSDWKSSAA